MKKTLFWACCLCIVGVLVYFLSRPAPPEPGQNYYADFLPEDTVAALSLYDMTGLSKAFPSTPLGRFLSKPVMHEMMEELEATNEDLEQYDAFYNAVADIMTSPVFRQVFGDDAVIALCPPNPEELRDNPEQGLKNAFLAFGTSSIAGPISRLARMVMRKDVTNAEIAGLGLTRIRLDDNEVVYGYDDQGIIVLAYDPERIVSAVQRKAVGENLRHSQSFTATEAFWKEAGPEHIYAHSYLNAMRLQELVSVFPQQETLGMAKAMAEKLAGLKSIGGLIVETQGELRVRMKGEIDSELLPDEVQAGEALSSGSKNFSSPLLQANTLLHYRLSHFDKAFFRNFMTSAETEQQYRELVESFQNEVGFSLDKFLEAVGPQAGISIHEIVNAGMFPLPKTVLAIQVQDKRAVGWALRKLRDTLKKQGVAIEHLEKTQGHRLYYWTIMPIEATHLAIALTDTTLYIANGESQLRALLKGSSQPEVSTKQEVKELRGTAGTCVATANLGAFLLRPAQLAAQIEPVADWLTDMLWANQTGSGKKIQKELLALMRSFDLVAACSDLTETHIKGEVIFKTLPAVNKKKK